MEIITCNNNEIKINSYIIKKNNRAIVIDPNNFNEIEEKLNNCKLDYILLTHEHFDHILAVDKLRKKYNAKLIAQKYTNTNIQKPSKNLSKFSNIILDFMNIKLSYTLEEFSINSADIIYEDSYKLNWEEEEYYFTYTPGHSKGSTCILIRNFLFTGDSLFECCETDTKGVGCSKKDYENITMPFFKSLNKNINVLAGHYEPFILNDKINAREKAIEIFKKRPKFTNCFVTYNEFIKLVDNSVFFIRQDSIFILKKDSNFYRFYYFINNYSSLSKLDSFLSKFKLPIVLEIVSKTHINEELFLNNQFKPYKVFSRYSTNTKSKMYESVKHAVESDVKEIQKLISNTFDHLVDYIPSNDELLNLIKKSEVFIIKTNNIIAGVSIFQKNGNSYYFRLSCVHENFRPGILGYMLASSSPSNGKRCIAWVEDTNIEAIKLNSILGYKPEGLKNYIYVKK